MSVPLQCISCDSLVCLTSLRAGPILDFQELYCVVAGLELVESCYQREPSSCDVVLLQAMLGDRSKLYEEQWMITNQVEPDDPGMVREENSSQIRLCGESLLEGLGELED